MVKDAKQLRSNAAGAASSNAVGIRAAKPGSVGFIRLGPMGAAMAANVAAAGYRVLAHLRHPTALGLIAAEEAGVQATLPRRAE